MDDYFDTGAANFSDLKQYKNHKISLDDILVQYIETCIIINRFKFT